MKKIASIILTIIFVISIVPMGFFRVVAITETTENFEGYYTYTVENEEAVITEVDVDINGYITVPSTLGGYSVTRIGKRAFEYCSSLTNIILPDTIIEIGDAAFYWCSSLKNIVLPNQLSKIGYSAFTRCDSLESINIPNSVLCIHSSAFAGCGKLTDISIGNKTTRIESQAFYVCDKLKNVYFRGTEQDALAMDISDLNDPLMSATWYYNSCILTPEHAFEWITDLEPTCTETGIKHEECTLCHTTQNQNTVISATGNHNYEWIIDEENNCGLNGKKHKECNVCHKKIDQNTLISATGNHTYDNTCDTKCNVCEYTRSVPHYFEWIIDKQETCGESGIKHEKCTVCNANRNENTVISATGKHSFDNACDCICNVCEYTRSVPHYFEWIIDKQETCGGPGVKHEKCTVCNANRNENTVIPATGKHSYDNACDNMCNVCDEVRETTHTYEDDTDLLCDICGYTKRSYVVTYNGNGQSGAPATATKIEGRDLILSQMTSSSYKFLGWSKTPYGNIDYSSVYTQDENATLYAKWGKHCYNCDDKGSTSDREYKYVRCSRCSGSGSVSSSVRRCVQCHSTYILTGSGYNPSLGQTIYGEYCGDCGGRGFERKQDCDSCFGDGYKYDWVTTTKQCINCGGKGFCSIAQIKAPKPQLGNKTTTSITLIKVDGVDYSKDGEVWQESNIFENLTPGKQYTFFMRYKANSVNTVGPKSDSLIVTMVTSEITSSKHTISGNNISKITAGTTVSSLLSGLNKGAYCKVYKGNSVVGGNTAVGTGMVVKIMDGNTVKASYTVIVTGDTNGDGTISVTDMIAIKAHILNKSTLTGVYATVANTNGDSGISITDFIQVKAKILGKGSITAR